MVKAWKWLGAGLGLGLTAASMYALAQPIPGINISNLPYTSVVNATDGVIVDYGWPGPGNGPGSTTITTVRQLAFAVWQAAIGTGLFDVFVANWTLSTGATAGFTHPCPSMPGAPTGSPTQSYAAPECVWNSVTHTLNIYDSSGWWHIAGTAGAG